jgi:hypothetical protein
METFVVDRVTLIPGFDFHAIGNPQKYRTLQYTLIHVSGSPAYSLSDILAIPLKYTQTTKI